MLRLVADVSGRNQSAAKRALKVRFQACRTAEAKSVLLAKICAEAADAPRVGLNQSNDLKVCRVKHGIGAAHKWRIDGRLNPLVLMSRWKKSAIPAAYHGA